jgi:hypothetical protein
MAQTRTGKKKITRPLPGNKAPSEQRVKNSDTEISSQQLTDIRTPKKCLVWILFIPYEQTFMDQDIISEHITSLSLNLYALPIFKRKIHHKNEEKEE